MPQPLRCSKIVEADAAVSVNENKWLVMQMHVQLKLDELWGPPNPSLTVTGRCLASCCPQPLRPYYNAVPFIWVHC
jgi:hypothetical protein